MHTTLVSTSHQIGDQLVARRWFALTAAIGLLFIMPAVCDGQPDTRASASNERSLDVAQRTAILDAITDKIEQLYVDPEVGKRICERLRERQSRGAYRSITSLHQLTRRLTEDMQAVSGDMHIGVITPDQLPQGARVPGQAGEDSEEADVASARRANFGFERAERLKGNVGYLKLTTLEHSDVGGRTAVAAMAFLAHCDAIVIDLRDNFGGRSEMIQLLLSYFFEDPVHISTKIRRERDHQRQDWTLPYVPGAKMVDVPLYVLTGRHTVSGGEALAYFLQSLERATVIGKATPGAANMTHAHTLSDLGIVVFVPDATSISPATGTNWAKSGVRPDIDVAENQALRVAHIEALRALAARGVDDEELRYEMEWALKGLKAEQSPVTLSEGELRSYEGVYGPVKVSMRNGRLHYRHEGRPGFPLTPMGDNLFALDGWEYVRVQFIMGGAGSATEVVHMTDLGQREPHERTGE